MIISTHRSWLPGDPRGFCSRGHRIHSTGHYRNPPPPGEHLGLYIYNEPDLPCVKLSDQVRQKIGAAIVRYFADEGHRLLARSVGTTHAYLLVELPEDLGLVRQIVGRCKNFASRAVRRELPGKVWGEGGSFQVVQSPEYQRTVYRYITEKQEPGAWVWTFRSAESS